MAKVLFTAAVADIRGKLAGTVFSKNRAGAFIRTKVTPTNRRTPAQAAARSKFSALSAAWRNLTGPQRASWQAQATNVAGTDVFGNAKTISGQQLFVGTNSNFLQLGQAVVNTAPASKAPTYTGMPRAESALTGTTMSGLALIMSDVVGADTKFLVAATEPLSPGIYNADGKYRSLGVVATPGVAMDIIIPYSTKFGSTTAGQKIFIEMTPVSISTGKSSAKIILQLIAGGASVTLMSKAELENEFGDIVEEDSEGDTKAAGKRGRKASDSAE